MTSNRVDPTSYGCNSAATPSPAGHAASRDVTAGSRAGSSALSNGTHEREQALWAAFVHSLDGILLSGADGSVFAANPAACDMLRASEEEICRGGRAAIVDATDARLDHALETRARTGRFRGELTFVRRDGTKFPAELSSAVFSEADGAVRTVIVFRDITERKRAEETLRVAERRFQQAFEHSPDAISITRLHDGLYVDVNAGAVEFLGYEKDEIVGRSSLELGIWANPDDRAPFLATLASAGEVSNYEARFRRRDGTERTGLVSAAIVSLASEAHLLSTTRDITERKRVEQELRESHELLLNLAKMVPGVIYQYRLFPDGRSAFPYASPGLNDIYEVTPEQVREDATPVFGRLHPDDAADVTRAIQHSAETLEMFYCQFRVVLPRQGLRWRWSHAHPVRTADGGTLWHGIILDITEQKRVEAEKATLEAQLQHAQKMESVGRLAGGVAHDFNNMLGVIIGHAELAMAHLPPSAAVRSDLEEIQRAARRSADLTRQLLAFARRQVVAPKVLDLNDTVAGTVTMLRRLIGENIRLTWARTPHLWPVKVDPSQIDQLLANLCVNARDAISGVGNVTIALTNVTVETDDPELPPGTNAGDFVRVSVRDDGCGMDEHTLSRVFEPFFTTKALGQGTGLGLSTVYGIAQQNDGFITVRSAPGQGTTMMVHFPRHRAESERPSLDSAPPIAPRGRETILLVEDEPTLLRLTTLMLERLGYTVLAARSADEALRFAAERGAEINLLITDVVMPDMNGRDLAHRVVAMYPSIRQMLMSGYTPDVIAAHGVLSDDVVLIHKPFSINDLAWKVREAIDRS